MSWFIFSHLFSMFQSSLLSRVTGETKRRTHFPCQCSQIDLLLRVNTKNAINAMHSCCWINFTCRHSPQFRETEEGQKEREKSSTDVLLLYLLKLELSSWRDVNAKSIICDQMNAMEYLLMALWRKRQKEI